MDQGIIDCIQTSAPNTEGYDDDDELACKICFTDRGRFKLSTEDSCTHYFCTTADGSGGCIRRYMDRVVQSGAFPGRCPGCLDEFREVDPERGTIQAPILAVLRQQEIIDRDLEVRFMLRQEPDDKVNAKTTFKCPVRHHLTAVLVCCATTIRCLCLQPVSCNKLTPNQRHHNRVLLATNGLCSHRSQ